MADLAERLGLSFQQVQKYETGKTRVGSGRLCQIAAALEVPPETLFAGAAAGRARKADRTALQLFADPRSFRLLRAFARIRAAHTRRSFFRMAEALARLYA